jgi:hypothetical protein
MPNLNVKNSLHCEITKLNNLPKCFDSMSIIPPRWDEKRAILNVSYLFKCPWVTEVWFFCSGKY